MRCAFSRETAAWTPRRRSSSGSAAVGSGGLAASRADRRRGGGRRRRGQRREVRAELVEELVVEVVLALQVLLDDLQEAPGLGALDDAVVVGRGHRHDLLGADHLPDGGEPDRVADRAGRDDRALAGHEPRDGGDRADAAGVRQRDVGADEVVGGELVVAGAGDEAAEAVEELGERQAPGVADDRDHERAAAVLLLDVDGDAEVDGAVVDAMRLPVDLVEVVRHDRHLLGRRARDRVGDEVREGDLVARRLQLAAARVHRRDGHRAQRGRGRDLARGLHVAREHRRAALELGGAGGRGARAPRRAAAAAGRPARSLGGEHVGLRDPPGGAAAVHRGDVDALGGGDAARDGRGVAPLPSWAAVAAAAAGRRRARPGAAPGGAAARARRCGRGRWRRHCRAACGRSSGRRRPSRRPRRGSRRSCP